VITSLPSPPAEASSVSVVIPARNAAATIAEQLRRVGAEALAVPWTIVVADNGSTDATPDLVRNHARVDGRVRLVDASGARGPAHARNAGARAATGELLCFCDADDEVEPGWLPALVAGAAGHHFVAGRLDVDTINAPAVRRRRPRPPAAQLTPPPFAPSGNFAVWSDVFTAAGGFDETLRTSEDVDLSRRLVAAGGRMGWAPDALVHYRFRASAWAAFWQTFRSAWFSVAAARRAGTRRGVSAGEVGRRALWLVLRLPYLAVAARRGVWLDRLARLKGEALATLWYALADRVRSRRTRTTP
jgi:glycosyltransferase involved in cell wall biosynthesis